MTRNTEAGVQFLRYRKMSFDLWGEGGKGKTLDPCVEHLKGMPSGLDEKRVLNKRGGYTIHGN